jgi:Flp pilus assembly protein CpaB
LELTPPQAETVILAQRTGQLSLALRGMTDKNEASEQYQYYGTGVTVVRNGRVEYNATGRVEHVVSHEQGTGRTTDR